MLSQHGLLLVAGIDEAGRGPLAGPVFAAAVILNVDKPIFGLTDSKQLTEKKRNYFYELIKEKSLDWSVACASAEEIDAINILQASLLAMQRAFSALKIIPELTLVDGNHLPKINGKAKAIIKGDELEPSISAASIIAKVTRDREMYLLDKQFPQYGFAKHKGYSTREHLIALRKYGPCVVHRKSFQPVGSLIEPV